MGSRWQVLLPKTKFPLRVNPATHEPAIQHAAQFDHLYKWQQRQPTKKCFVLHDGPPYANGKPHMGHALNKILKDIINRYKMMRGHRVFYRPGWDCHGLPIELKACRGLVNKGSSALQIREVAAKFAQETMEKQAQAFKRWGILGDWENPYVTMEKEYEANQLQVFYQMYKKGCIYRSFKPVYWSPSSYTALAEAELEYQDHQSRSVFVLFPSLLPASLVSPSIGSNQVHALVWTTTPWTLPANRAICYHPDHKYSLVRQTKTGDVILVGSDRLSALDSILGPVQLINGSIIGSSLSGATYSNPLFDGQTGLPFLPGDHVSSEEGTGLVHTAPAHGFEDYSVGLNNNLELQCMVDEHGRYTKETGLELAGLSVLDAGNEAVISHLQASGHLLHEESYSHRYPYDWRTKKPVVIRSTEQWFARVSSLKDSALSILKHIETIPSGGAKVLADMLEWRQDWCISRQRVWGVPIPAFFHREREGEVLLNDEVFQHVEELVRCQGSDCWWQLTTEQLLPASLRDRAEEYTKGTDTMDVWFDSGSSWATVLQQSEGQADLYLEGKDQYRGWFQSSLLTSVAVQNKAPYRQLVTHGFVLDAEGTKMSKSVGNVLTPEEVLHKKGFGADVLRLWVASSTYTSDVAISRGILEQTNNFLQKIRNTFRFMLGNLADFDSTKNLVPYLDLPPLDKYQLHLLHQFIQTSAQAYDSFTFSKLHHSLVKFIPEDLSAFYFDIAKDRLYCEAPGSPARRSTQTVLHYLLLYLTSSLAPVLPHLVEEIAQHYPFEQGSVFKAGWRDCPDKWYQSSLAGDFYVLREVRAISNKALSEARSRQVIRSFLAASTHLHTTSPKLASLISSIFPKDSVISTKQTSSHHYHSLSDFLLVSQASLSDTCGKDMAAGSAEGTVEWPGEEEKCSVHVSVQMSGLHKCPRCWKHTSSEEDCPCDRCSSVMK